MNLPRVVVVGLGPGGADLTATGVVERVAGVAVRFLRTVRHPAADAVPGATSGDGS